MIASASHVAWFETLGRDDVAIMGGKNASLGEMVRHLTRRGVKVRPVSRRRQTLIGGSWKRTGCATSSPIR